MSSPDEIFDPIEHDGKRVRLYPNADNPIHSQPVDAIYCSPYFFCDGTNPEDGPDYYLGDVMAFNDKVEVQP